jgi:O-antigen/teichoic acid export membrane protein
LPGRRNTSSITRRVREGFGFNRTVSKNIRVKAASEIVAKAGRFLLILFAARILGVSQFGTFSFAFAFGNILANISDFGLQMYLSREVAQSPARRRSVLAQVARAKLILVAGVGAILIAALLLYPRPGDVRLLMALMTAVAVLHSWNELWNYFFRGIQSLREEAMLNLLNMGIGAAAGLTLLFTGAGAIGLCLGLLAAEAITLAVAVPLLRSRLGPGADVPVPRAASAIREAAPVGIAILLSILYFRIDVVFLERMVGDAAVGAYSAAYRILEGFLFLPAIFLAALYPAFAESARTDPAEMRRIYGNSLRWMGLLALLIVAGCVLFAPLGLRLLYGRAYEDSAPVLRVLAPSLFFIFVNYALTHFLVALRGQKWNAVFAGACLAVNVACNLVLIPRYGGIGAAIATVATEAALFLLCFVAVRRGMAARA